jgi:hypothetical protein
MLVDRYNLVVAESTVKDNSALLDMDKRDCRLDNYVQCNDVGLSSSCFTPIARLYLVRISIIFSNNFKIFLGTCKLITRDDHVQYMKIL